MLAISAKVLAITAHARWRAHYKKCEACQTGKACTRGLEICEQVWVEKREADDEDHKRHA